MSKLTFILLCSAFLLLVAPPVFAQDGCQLSPENPTAVLAVLGSAGALFSTLRNRARRKR